ncbi:hypothetical protein BFC17_15505 [Alteromonas lipolytica]|uniref:Solitary outer membrane autotransporter-like beta-barrel domain-containing protein n=2 Tax=Alteromonas lipolytica TaxID=1856405 RepID=A0A1E8FHE3_9ALTE|nr:hypothetical protein BFC17_15505 [Alteromonas lipolytica]
MTLGFHLEATAQESSFTDELNHIVAEFVAENTAMTVVVADSSLISLGIMDFDPNAFADFGDFDVGNEESFALRKSLRSYSLPWSFKPKKIAKGWLSHYAVRVSYVGSEQDIVYDNPDFINTFDEESYLLYGEKGWEYQLRKQWTLSFAMGGQYLYYHNSFDYQDPTLLLLRGFFDGQVLNTSYQAWLVDPVVSATYRGHLFGQRFDYKIQYRHALGRTFATDNHNQHTQIETGRFSNTLTFHYETPNVFGRQSQVRTLLRRIDLTGDATAPMVTSHYYQFGVGWLVDTSGPDSWLDNLGIGVSLNAGSNLSGGTVVILFNEEM